MTETASPAGDLQDCDMVMKGGITSGVVYPGVVVTLAETHRFRGLGGASAGAIAAAMAAAAEYGRANGGESFARLAGLPDDLGANMVDRLQPAAPLARLWNFLLGEMEHSSARKRNGAKAKMPQLAASVARALWLVARTAPVVVGGSLVVAVILGLVLGMTWGGWAFGFGALLGLIIVAIGLALGARRLVASSVEALEANDFGFCDGHTPTPGHSDTMVLTDWLNDEMRRLAGLSSPEVLTFAHLWGDEATAAYRAALTDGRHNPPETSITRQRVIDLSMMVTNLGQGRAQKFPFDLRSYFWCPSCLARFFDDDVLAQMRATGQPLEETDEYDIHCPRHPETILRSLPAAPDLPVVVGVRISFSFPVLFSAVPLHTVDWTRTKGNRGAKICWFADGGITSNFPMHFFDSLIPDRPTFGISLGPANPDYPDSSVFRPSHRYGWQLGVTDIASLAGSFAALRNAMQNWQDRSLQTLPGYRDRIVDVRLGDGEGGMNLTMPPEVITGLSRRGEEAAELFETFEMDPHRWTRFRVALSELADVLRSLERQWGTGDVVGTPIAELVSDPPAKLPYEVSEATRAELQRAAEALAAWARQWEDSGSPGEANAPRPKPQLRTTLRL